MQPNHWRWFWGLTQKPFLLRLPQEETKKVISILLHKWYYYSKEDSFTIPIGCFQNTNSTAFSHTTYILTLKCSVTQSLTKYQPWYHDNCISPNICFSFSVVVWSFKDTTKGIYCTDLFRLITDWIQSISLKRSVQGQCNDDTFTASNFQGKLFILHFPYSLICIVFPKFRLGSTSGQIVSKYMNTNMEYILYQANNLFYLLLVFASFESSTNLLLPCIR